MNKFVCGLCILACIWSCSNRKVGIASKVDIKINSISFEKIPVDLSKTSGVGYSGVWNDSLYFFDVVTSYLYMIDRNGTLSEKRLGFGRGPREIPTRNIDEVCINPTNNCLEILADIVAFRYDGVHPVTMSTMKYEGKDKNYSSPLAYTTWNEVVLRAYNDRLYYNVLGSLEAVPMLDPAYFSKAAIIMCDHLKSGKMELIGSYSDYYRDNRDKIKHLPYIYFDLDEKGNLLVSFQADPLIYRYDKDRHVAEIFGTAGKEIKTNYSNSGNTAERFEAAFRKDTENAGYYYWLENVGNLTFRSYQKSGGKEHDGLQIYDDSTLIGDVDTPKQFRVAGLLDNRYATKLYIDEDTGESYYYIFSINYK